jgi:ArsR family transcriptional regulator, virulence genes transcriptional regulator
MKIRIDPEQMRASAEDACDLLKALASPHRLMIVCMLVDGPMKVSAIAAELDQRETLVSQHLAILRRQRIVTTRREGQAIWYAIGSPAAHAVIEALAAHFCKPAGVRPAQRKLRPGA